MTTLLARVASSVLGALLVYAILIHFQPHITNWILGPAMIVGSVVCRIVATILIPYPRGTHADH